MRCNGILGGKLYDSPESKVYDRLGDPVPDHRHIVKVGHLQHVLLCKTPC